MNSFKMLVVKTLAKIGHEAGIKILFFLSRCFVRGSECHKRVCKFREPKLKKRQRTLFVNDTWMGLAVGWLGTNQLKSVADASIC